MAPRSSIFNFETVTSLLRLPLRVHVWDALLLLGMIAILVASSMALRPFAVDYSTPMPRYPHATEVMLLGDSRLEYLDTWDYPTRDCAMPSTGYLFQNAIFKALSPKMPRLQVLIVPLSILDYHKADVRGHWGDYRDLVGWGVPWYEIPGTSPWERLVFAVSYNRFMAPMLVGPKVDVDFFKRVHVFSSKKAYAQKLGDPAPFTAPNPETSPELESTEDIIAKLAPYAGAAELEPSEHHKAALFKTIELCRSRGIHVVFVQVPAPDNLLRATFPIADEQTAELYADVQKHFPDMPIPVWDAEHEEGIYGRDMFRDHLHLNKKGLARWNAYLNAKLCAYKPNDDAPPLLPNLRRTYNLLPSDSPMQLPNNWNASKGITFARCEVPEALRGVAQTVTQITLPPQGSLYQATEVFVRAGITTAGSMWLWAPGDTDTRGLRIMLARHGTGNWEAGQLLIPSLTRTPTQFAATATFQEDHKSVRLELLNDSPNSITLFMAAPVIKNVYGDKAE